MARFKITTPVPGWDGNVGEKETGVPVTRFADGEATIDVIDQGSASRLAYFRSAGYIVEPLDGMSAEVAIRSAVLTVGQEAAALQAENAELTKVSEIEALRRENARLRELAAERMNTLSRDDTAGQVKRGGTVKAGSGDDVAPVAPGDDASVTEWRAYAVAHLGLSESEVRGWDKRALQKREADRQAAAAIEGSNA